MAAALIILLGLLAASPIVVFYPGPIPLGLSAILLSLGLRLAASHLPQGEAYHLQKLIRFLVIPFLALAIWILIQMLPLPFVAHPFWASVWNALRQSRLGSITIDIGDTAAALIAYLALLAMALLSTMISINRLRAKWILIGATIALVLIALCIGLADLFNINLPGAAEEAHDCACLGVVLTTASATLIIEQRESSLRRGAAAQANSRWSGVACAIGFVICAATIFATRSGSLIFAAGFGLFSFCSLILIRRLALGRIITVTISLTAVIIGVVLLLSGSGKNSDPRLAFVKKSPAAIEMTELLLERTPLLGNGAGTLGTILPIYQTSADVTNGVEAETAAARLSVEMGRPVLWLVALATFAGALRLVQGALERGRDSFYPAAGAASLITLLLLGFVNSGVYGSGLSLIATAILGTALAQSVSRTAS